MGARGGGARGAGALFAPGAAAAPGFGTEKDRKTHGNQQYGIMRGDEKKNRGEEGGGRGLTCSGNGGRGRGAFLSRGIGSRFAHGQGVIFVMQHLQAHQQKEAFKAFKLQSFKATRRK